MSLSDEEEQALQPFFAHVESNSLNLLEDAAKRAYAGTTDQVLDDAKGVKARSALKWHLIESLGEDLSCAKSVSKVLKRVDAVYLKSISKRGAVSVHAGLSAEAYEQEVDRQLSAAAEQIEFSNNAGNVSALKAIEDARTYLKSLGLDGDTKLALQHVYDPESKRGFHTVMVIKVITASDGVSKHVVTGRGTVYYEYKDKNWRGKAIDFGAKADDLNQPTLELAAIASVKKEVQKLKPHRGKWEATKEEVTWVFSLLTDTTCAVITALKPLGVGA